MEQKIAQFINKGMVQDYSISKQSNEFAFENHNIRITTNGENSLLSITNEKSNTDLFGGQSIVIYGTVIGHAVLEDTVIVFAKDENETVSGITDYIYKIIIRDNYSNKTVLYSGNLGFSVSNPIETLVSYESDLVQKIYWVDGINPPRMINIAADSDTKKNWSDTSFDFVSDIIPQSDGLVVEKLFLSQGVFPSGVIQYVVTYYNKFGSESNPAYISPLYYISPNNRGGKKDETCDCSFKIIISGIPIGGTYERYRIYSLLRTSYNGEVVAHLVKDGENTFNIEVIDNGINQELVDSSSLIFAKASIFYPSTIEAKDNTLFLGGLTTTNKDFSDIKTLISKYRNSEGVLKDDILYFTSKERFVVKESDFLSDDSLQLQFSSKEIKSFKHGETYRVAVQFIDRKGIESEPILLGDLTNNKFPEIKKNIVDDETQYSYVYPTIVFNLFAIDENIVSLLEEKDVVSYKLLMAETNSSTRRTLAQGFVSPTVFNLNERNNGSVVAEASWFPRFANQDFHLHNVNAKGLSDEQYFELDTITSSNIFGGTYDVPNSVYIENITDYGDGTEYIWELIKSNIHVYSSAISNLPYLTITYYFNIYDKNHNLIEKDVHILVLQSQLWDNPINLNSVGIVTENILLILNQKIDVYYNTALTKANAYNATYYNESISTLYGFEDVIIAKAQEESILRSLINGKEFIYVEYYKEDIIDKYDNSFFTDASIVSFFSPDLDNISDSSNLKFKIIGAAKVNNIRSDYDLVVDNTNGGKVEKFNVNNITDKYGKFSGLKTQFCYYNDSADESPKGMYAIMPWHKSPSITGTHSKDTNILKRKTIGNVWTCDTIYNSAETNIYWQPDYGIYKVNKHLKENTINTTNYGIYKGNYDNLLSPKNIDKPFISLYKPSSTPLLKEDIDYIPTIIVSNEVNSTVRIKYNTIDHAIIGFKPLENTEVILPYYWNFNFYRGNKINALNTNINSTITTWDGIDSSIVQNNSILWIGELYRDLTSPYGEFDEDTLKSTTFIPISGIQHIWDIKVLYGTEGDTYYQRWECLKTYPTTEEDLNSVVDVVSVMLETYTNLDGRSDVNKDRQDLLNVRPENSNIINPVYTQPNNFYTSNILDSKFNNNKYLNSFTWSLAKNSNADIDNWTKGLMINVESLDGSKGKLNKIKLWNDYLICFQDKGISRINYNNQSIIATEQGVPVEIANSGKVNGYSYINTNSGCQNKWSIAESPAGLYFIDGYNKSINLFNGSITSISNSKGFRDWSLNNLNSKIWDPKTNEGYCGSYDLVRNDYYITNKDVCLCFSEQLEAFSSFYDYMKSPNMFNVKDLFVGFAPYDDKVTLLWKQFEGDGYCNFYYEENKPFYMEYKINPEPLSDKLFNNIEYRCDFWKNDVYQPNETFDHLKVWNEYQEGNTVNINNSRHKYPNSEKKFRIWRLDIPRDKSNNRDRIRNPWINLKLTKNTNTNYKMVMHDLIVKYFE